MLESISETVRTMVSLPYIAGSRPDGKLSIIIANADYICSFFNSLM